MLCASFTCDCCTIKRNGKTFVFPCAAVLYHLLSSLVCFTFFLHYLVCLCILAALMKNTGRILANDANKDRIKSIVGNVHRCGITNVVVSNEDGRSFPKVSKILIRHHVKVGFPAAGTAAVEFRNMR